MSGDLVTVVTPTLGHSAWRLGVILRELRKFTQIPFRHIVCDDGTISERSVQGQREVCEAYGAEHLVNPGPCYGVSYNLNYLFEQVKTPWAFLLEDGLRPGAGWLESAVSFLEKVEGVAIGGHEIGMVGTTHIQDWTLVMAGAIPTKRSVVEFFVQSARGGEFYEDWNDGFWCWPRLLPGLREACLGDTSDWRDEMVVLRRLVLEDAVTHNHPVEQALLRLKFRTRDRFPQNRRSEVVWFPGACMLVNVEKWRRVGRFRNGCTMFEGHLGIRMGVHGYLSVALEFPPWLHAPSLGFSAALLGKEPRVHISTSDIFAQDFEGRSHVEAVDLVGGVIPPTSQVEINERLAEIECEYAPGWEAYL